MINTIILHMYLLQNSKIQQLTNIPNLIIINIDKL